MPQITAKTADEFRIRRNLVSRPPSCRHSVRSGHPESVYPKHVHTLFIIQNRKVMYFFRTNISIHHNPLNINAKLGIKWIVFISDKSTKKSGGWTKCEIRMHIKNLRRKNIASALFPFFRNQDGKRPFRTRARHVFRLAGFVLRTWSERVRMHERTNVFAVGTAIIQPEV